MPEMLLAWEDCITNEDRPCRDSREQAANQGRNADGEVEHGTSNERNSNVYDQIKIHIKIFGTLVYCKYTQDIREGTERTRFSYKQREGITI